MVVLECGDCYMVHARRAVAQRGTDWVVTGHHSMLTATYQPGTEPEQQWGHHHKDLAAIGTMDDTSQPDQVDAMINIGLSF